jgi:LysW-gamma-L-lysine carboxypeptidase
MAAEIETQTANQRRIEERSDLVLQVISTYSPSGHESGVAKIIFDYLKKRKMSPRIDLAGNVICEIGEGDYSILLCGHMDTVPGELQVKMEGDWVFGRGACDAKGALLSLIFGFENLAGAHKKNAIGKVIFAGVTEEEQSSSGLAELIRTDAKANFAIFGEPGGSSKITVGYRGHLTVRIIIVTPEVHASAPKLVTNSAELLYEIYRSIKEGLGAENDGSLDRPSASITEIRSGTAHNVIPGKTVGTFDIRVPLGKTTELFRVTIQEIVEGFRGRITDAAISLSFDEPTEPYRVPLNSALVRVINRAILKTGAKPSLITKSGTGDMNTYAVAFGVDAVTYGPGEAKLSHSSEEKVTISEIFACADIVSNATLELFEMNQKNTTSKDVS